MKVVEASVANSKYSITGQQGILDAKPDGLGAVSLSTGTLCKQLYSANRYAYRLWRRFKFNLPVQAAIISHKMGDAAN